MYATSLYGTILILRVKDVPIFCHAWYDKGIKYVKDIIDEKGYLLDYAKLCQKFNLETQRLLYNSISQAIPKEWKIMLKSQDDFENTSLYNDNYQKGNFSRVIYCKLMSNENLISTKVQKLNFMLGSSLEVDEVKNLIRNINKLTICVKLRSFQYKLLMQGVITNVNLKYYGIKSTDQCTFCNQATETYIHLFVECNKVKPILKFIQQKLNLHELNATQIITNKVVSNMKHVENCIMLITKFYIYKTRCAQERLSVKSCENYIRAYKNTEEYIAKSHNKIIFAQSKMVKLKFKCIRMYKENAH